MRRLSLGVFLALSTFCLLQGMYYFPQLPERVAVHFNTAGRPDAWSAKTAFLAFYYIVTGTSVVLFLGLSYIMVLIPVKLINLPNKDYWLSDERREETLGFLCRYFLWFGSATILLLIDVFHQSMLVNLGKAETLPHVGHSISAYIVFSAVWIAGLFVRFGKKGGPR